MKINSKIQFISLLLPIIMTTFLGCMEREEYNGHFDGYHGYCSMSLYDITLNKNFFLNTFNSTMNITVLEIQRYSGEMLVTFNYDLNESKNIESSHFDNTIILNPRYTEIYITYNSPNMIIERDVPEDKWDTFLKNITSIKRKEKNIHDEYVNSLISLIENILHLPSPLHYHTDEELFYFPS